MLQQAEFESLVGKARQDPRIARDEREVTAKYGPMFTPQGIAALNPTAFRAFLTIGENRHWNPIHRYGGRLTADFPLLKSALAVLVDETKPIAGRIDEARGMVRGRGLGKAVISAILTVAHPTKYGVYNSVSEAGLKEIGMYPDGIDALSTGKRYEQVNRVLTDLSARYKISFWALDIIWEQLGAGDESVSSPPTPAEPVLGKETPIGGAPPGSFVFEEERQLESFLLDHWDQIGQLNALEILTDEDGEIIGDQFRIAGIGKVDILCRNKDGSGFTVVELKLKRTNDDVIGQVTRYMGGVKADSNLMKDGQSVSGLIICLDADKKLMRSLLVVPNVELLTYEYQARFSLFKKA